MSEPVKQFFRFILFILAQALVLNNLPPIHRFISIFVYIQFVLWLPFFARRGWVVFLSFLLGFVLDMFAKTPGLHASAALWVGLLRGPMINLLVPRETRELTHGSPSIRSMGFAGYLIYMSVLTLFHNIFLSLLESLNIGDWVYFFGKVFFSTVISVLLMLLLEVIFRPVSRTRDY